MASQFRRGDEAVLDGLSAINFNGRIAQIEEWMPDAGRWSVAVRADGRGPAESGLLIKPQNLVPFNAYFEDQRSSASSDLDSEDAARDRPIGVSQVAVDVGVEEFPDRISSSDDDADAGGGEPVIELAPRTQNLVDDVRRSVSESFSSTPPTSPGPGRQTSSSGERRSSSAIRQEMSDQIRAVESGDPSIARTTSERRRINSLGKSVHVARPNPDEDSDADDTDRDAHARNIVSESTRKRLQKFYMANKTDRFVKNVRRAPGSAPHLSYVCECICCM